MCAKSIQTDYLRCIYDRKRYSHIFQRSAQALEELDKILPFDAIAFRGTSGAALAYPLALSLSKHLLCVRKEASHYPLGKVEGPKKVASYIIVDDFIDTGHTVNQIIREVRKFCGITPAAIYLYSPACYRGRWWKPKVAKLALTKIPILSSLRSSNFSIEELRVRFS